MMGDWNACLGQEAGLRNNDTFISYGGKEVLREIEEGDWNLINGMSNECHKSHLDRSSSVERCLDYAIINTSEVVEKVSTDPERKATPYTQIVKKKSVIGKKFSDHRTLAFSLNLFKRKTIIKPNIRFIKSEESIEAFKQKTNSLATELIPVVNREDCDMNLLFRTIDREITRIKYSTHKPMRPSRSQKETIDESAGNL